MIFEHDFCMGIKDIGKDNFIKNRAILEMLEDMIMIAMNNANKKAENFKAEKLSKFGNIPGLL